MNATIGGMAQRAEVALDDQEAVLSGSFGLHVGVGGTTPNGTPCSSIVSTRAELHDGVQRRRA